MAHTHPLAEWRKETGVTQKQVADSLNVVAATVSKWECGTLNPSLRTLERIHRLTAGAVTPNDFFNANFVTGMSAERARRELDAE